MSCIEPNSPQESTRCYCGRIHRLGETDCCDEFVGYIEDNCTYRDLRERDIAQTLGKYTEAFRLWNLTGGLLGQPPMPRAFAERHCHDPLHEDEAAEMCVEVTDPNDPLNQLIALHMAQHARLN